MINQRSIVGLLFIALLFGISSKTKAQSHSGDVFVDKSGVIRWGDTKKEVHGFGVNYTAPFAHAYRSAEKKGFDIKKEIDKDVYHFARLGFDLYRIHVWDTEISDEEGNLLENEHLETFDYLLNQLKQHGINFVITPIAYWGNGWPEPDEDTPGFSDKYGKDKSLTNPDAIKAQENYLAQFLNHINPYTGIAYKNEPNLIAVEISNEPHHRGTPQEVTAFIKKMVSAIQSTGAKKPVFYNVSHSIHLADAYFDAGIQGGTFQWYPTGLGFGKELEGNLLPNVNEYDIPFNEVIKEHHAAKIVYEFDAADVNKSYMYPAMARSFREAGIQLATHFAYDPTFLAYANTEYNTHYMNLNYVPHKALGLMIASEIFHEVPLGKEQGTYPENLQFGDFKISYDGDVASYNSSEKFIYTNSTKIEPKNASKLKAIAGHGNSQIVKYNGRGAYFLDKLEMGIWRLEVMPDPVIVKNPFGKNSLDKTVAVISWKANTMKLNIEELGGDFNISGINSGNNFEAEVKGGEFNITPGTYLLKSNGKSFGLDKYKSDKRFDLKGFQAPRSTVDKTYLVHQPAEISEINARLEIQATVVSNNNIEKVEAWFQNGNTYESAKLKAGNNYDYSVEVPEKVLDNGFLNYRIIVTTDKGKITFPGGVEGSPSDWDFHSSASYEVPIVYKNTPVSLFNASKDSDKMVRQWFPGNKVIPVNESVSEFQVRVDQLFHEDVENKNAEPIYDYSFRYNFNQNIANRPINTKNKLVLTARSLNDKSEKIQVSLVMDNGASFGKIVELSPEVKEISIDLNELKPVKTVTLPRPYPGFLPYYFDHSYKGDLKLENVESVQFSIGPGIEAENLQTAHSVGIRSLKLE